MSAAQLILCHDCDLACQVGEVPEGSSARCPRCRGLLYRRIANSIDRTLAFALSGLMLFVVANSFPFLALEMDGNITRTTLISGVEALYEQDQNAVATLVLITTILAPAFQLCALLWVLVPLRMGRGAPGSLPVFRLLHRIEPWSMMEVFMVGILVSLVKLAEMASIVPGIALWAFVALIPCVAAASSSLDHHMVWDAIGEEA